MYNLTDDINFPEEEESPSLYDPADNFDLNYSQIKQEKDENRN